MPKLRVARTRVVKPAPRTGKPPFPFNSWWEYELHKLFIARDPRWMAQVQFGRRGEVGATRPDWIHPVRKIAFYLDTPIHKIFRLEGRDQILRASLRAEGWRVVVWDVPSEQYAVTNFSLWYRNVIDGTGYGVRV